MYITTGFRSGFLVRLWSACFNHLQDERVKAATPDQSSDQSLPTLNPRGGHHVISFIKTNTGWFSWLMYYSVFGFTLGKCVFQ